MTTLNTRPGIRALLLATAIGSPLAIASPPPAKPTQAEGFGWGAVIGTLVAGPAGTVVGAGLGSMAGHNGELESTIERYRQQKIEREKLLNASRIRVEELQLSNRKLSGRITDLESRPELGPLLESLVQDIHFRTNSAVIEPHYYPRLEAMAAAVAKLPGLHLKMIGFADPRGSDKLNRTLSRQRVDALQRFLSRAGVPDAQLSAEYRGESDPLAHPAQPGLYPFERRVELRFEFKGERS